MRTRFLTVWLAAAAVFLCGMTGRIDPQPADLPTAINGFGQELLQRQPAGNQVLSPFSLHSALSMTAAGARGKTARQMQTVLRTATDSYSDLTQGLNLPELQIASALWLQQDYKTVPGFIDNAKENHLAAVLPADFKSAPERETAKINKWVEDKTHGRIQDLLAPGILTELSRLVLIQCIHFKGIWQIPFDENLTAPRPFYTQPGQSLMVPTMYRQGRWRYAQDHGLRIVELPYAGDRLAMLVILPDTDPKKFLAELEPDAIRRWQTALTEQQLRLYLPRFAFASAFRLEKTLAEMGMPLVFGPLADFSGISGRQDLKIDAVVHKAFIEVNEQGTEAAAASGVVMGLKSIAPQGIELHIDRPFVFCIIDKATNTEIFLGTVNKP